MINRRYTESKLEERSRCPKNECGQVSRYDSSGGGRSVEVDCRTRVSFVYSKTKGRRTKGERQRWWGGTGFKEDKTGRLIAKAEGG